MSLLAQASPFQNSSSSSIQGKRMARMKNTYNNITKEPQDEIPYRENAEGMEIKEKAEKISSILEKVNMNQVREDADDENLGDFVPRNIHIPKMATYSNSPDYPKSTMENVTKKEEAFTTNTQSMPSKNKHNGSAYHNSYLPAPYYKGLSSHKSTDSHSVPLVNGQLMEKLNYMIRLLEEQQKEPTQNILEEFVLYGLLGVFMIYLVDSFARAGKYIR